MIPGRGLRTLLIMQDVMLACVALAAAVVSAQLPGTTPANPFGDPARATKSTTTRATMGSGTISSTFW